MRRRDFSEPAANNKILSNNILMPVVVYNEAFMNFAL
jgi:hypothetical protein